MKATRPPNPYHVPEGCTASVRVDDEWRVLQSDTAKRCRWGGNRPCRRQAVAELNRGHRPWTQPRDNWWAYCGDHLYGRWVEDGSVMEWHVDREDAP
jgi:hypothetical protein